MYCSLNFCDSGPVIFLSFFVLIKTDIIYVTPHRIQDIELHLELFSALNVIWQHGYLYFIKNKIRSSLLCITKCYDHTVIISFLDSSEAFVNMIALCVKCLTATRC